MKEIVAIIRPQNVNATKDALADAGFPAFFAAKVLGRGKRHLGAAEMLAGAGHLGAAEMLAGPGHLHEAEIPPGPVGESLSERGRLVAKRMLTVIVDDEDAARVVEVLVRMNQSGNPGDGRIFVMPVQESWRVRDKANMTRIEV
jgi:nitrogen regulatory protein PII 2